MKIFAAAVALVMVIGFLVVAVIDYLQTSWLSANAAMSSVGRADKDTRMGPMIVHTQHIAVGAHSG